MWTPNEYALWLVSIDHVAATLAQAEGYLCQRHTLLEHFETWRKWLLNDYATRLGFPGGDTEVPGATLGDLIGTGHRETGGAGTGGADAQHADPNAGLSAGPDPAEQQAHPEPWADHGIREAGPTPFNVNAPKRHGEAPSVIGILRPGETATIRVNPAEPPQEA